MNTKKKILQNGDPKVSAIICCYNQERLKVTRTAIRSLFSQTYPLSHVLVVVDHNEALKCILAREFPQTIVVANTGESGLSGARNTGIAFSKSDYVLFFDDDAIADPDMTEHMVTAMKDPYVLGVGASIRPLWQGRAPQWFPEEFLWVVGCSYEGMLAGTVRNLIGAAMCIRRNVFDAAGPFDTCLGRKALGLPLGNEETELCIRASLHFPKSKFVYEAKSLCYHNVSSDRGTWRYLISRCTAEGLSKARLARLSGTASLRSERTYTRKTLPRGFIRALVQFARTGKLAALGKASAIVVGFGAVVLAYLYGRASQMGLHRPQAPLILPQKIHR